jgi:hypothetical protein
MSGICGSQSGICGSQSGICGSQYGVGDFQSGICGSRSGISFSRLLRKTISYYTPPQTKFGGYIGITLSVRPSTYLVSATPPKWLIGFL